MRIAMGIDDKIVGTIKAEAGGFDCQPDSDEKSLDFLRGYLAGVPDELLDGGSPEKVLEYLLDTRRGRSGWAMKVPDDWQIPADRKVPA